MTKTFVIGAVVAVLLQTGLLGNIIYDRASRLTNGTEVLLKSTMVDPRDIFRGHYTRLRLELSNVKKSSVDVEGKLERNKQVFVELAPSVDGYWKAIKLHGLLPTNLEAPILKATVRALPNTRAGSYRLRFPFDRYFAPKKRAQELEQQQLKGKLGIILSVGKDGVGVIKGISVDKKLIYSEPLI